MYQTTETPRLIPDAVTDARPFWADQILVDDDVDVVGALNVTYQRHLGYFVQADLTATFDGSTVTLDAPAPTLHVDVVDGRVLTADELHSLAHDILDLAGIVRAIEREQVTL